MELLVVRDWLAKGCARGRRMAWAGVVLLRLVSAICAEISEEWETNNYRYMSTIKEL